MADENINKQVEEAGAADAAPVEQYRRTERGLGTSVQRRGAEIARTMEVTPTGGTVWIVDKNVVNFRRESCTCDTYKHSRPRSRCHHWWAVAYTIDPPTADEYTVPEIVHEKPKRIRDYSKPMSEEEKLRRAARVQVVGGYSRHAHAYNEHLTTEFRDTMRFIPGFFAEIGQSLDTRVQAIRGPKNTPLAELLTGAFLHGHFNWSFRRTEGFLAFLQDVGVISAYPGFSLLGEFVRSHESTPILREVLAITAEPFRSYGPMTIAGDGTGASSNRFDDWRVEGKHGKEERTTRRWYKAHAACDVDTLAIVALYVTGKNVSEPRILIDHIIPELVGRGYDIERFQADGGYNSTEIRDLIIEMLGAIPDIPWGSNSVRAISYRWRNRVKHGAVIEKLHREFKEDEGKKFKAEYRYRVKVENLFSSIKERYGGSVRAQGGNGPENEILLKAICHNVHMLLLAAKVYKLDLTAMGPEIPATLAG